MKTNRDLNGLDWQENADGSWYAVTKNYKCVAMPKLPEEISTSEHFDMYTYDSMLYRWHEVEGVWLCIARHWLGCKGAQDAMLWAEEQLGKELRRIEIESDPEKREMAALRKRLEEAEYQLYKERDARRAYEQQQTISWRDYPPSYWSPRK